MSINIPNAPEPRKPNISNEERERRRQAMKAVRNREPHRGINNQLENGFYNDIDAKSVIQKEQPHYRLMAFMSANGYQIKEIATAVGMTPCHVSNVLRQPFMREMMIALQEDVKEDFQQQIIEAGQAAFQRAVELSEKAQSESVRADLNKYIVNRYLGMPTQAIETVGKPAEQMSDEELKQALGKVLGTKESSTVRQPRILANGQGVLDPMPTEGDDAPSESSSLSPASDLKSMLADEAALAKECSEPTDGVQSGHEVRLE